MLTGEESGVWRRGRGEQWPWRRLGRLQTNKTCRSNSDRRESERERERSCVVRGERGGGEPAVEPAVIKTRPAPSVPNDGASLTLITGTFSFHGPRNTGESANRSNPEETFKFTARTKSRRLKRSFPQPITLSKSKYSEWGLEFRQKQISALTFRNLCLSHLHLMGLFGLRREIAKCNTLFIQF